MATQPWRWSTGPKTSAGKQAVAKNADKGGLRPRLRALKKQVNQLLIDYSVSSIRKETGKT